MAAHRPTLNAQGYLFQLPSLGLPDPAGEWVQLRVAIGSHKSCALLLKRAMSSNALPLAKQDGKEKIVEAELDGAVWSFPMLQTSSHSSGSKSTSAPDLVKVHVKRQSASSYASSSKAQERVKLPNGLALVFLNKVTKQLEYDGALATQPKATKTEDNDHPQSNSINNPGATSQTLPNDVASTTAARAARSNRSRHTMDAAALQGWSQRLKSAQAQAQEQCDAFIDRAVKQRLQKAQLQNDRLPGLSPASVMAVSSASHNNRPGIPSKGTSGQERTTTSTLQWLLPLPLWTFLSEWMRTVVSLFGPSVGTRSVAKRPWPLKPTAARKKVRGKGREEYGGWWRGTGTLKAIITRIVWALTLLYFLVVLAHPVGSAGE